MAPRSPGLKILCTFFCHRVGSRTPVQEHAPGAAQQAWHVSRRTSQRCRFVYGTNKQMKRTQPVHYRKIPCIMYSAERCMDMPQYHVIPILYRCLWAQANISIWLILWLLGGDNLLLKKPLIVQCHVHTITTAAWTAGIRIFSTS